MLQALVFVSEKPTSSDAYLLVLRLLASDLLCEDVHIFRGQKLLDPWDCEWGKQAPLVEVELDQNAELAQGDKRLDNRDVGRDEKRGAQMDPRQPEVCHIRVSEARVLTREHELRRRYLIHFGVYPVEGAPRAACVRDDDQQGAWTNGAEHGAVLGDAVLLTRAALRGTVESDRQGQVQGAD
jgi:hypothetical protein